MTKVKRKGTRVIGIRWEEGNETIEMSVGVVEGGARKRKGGFVVPK